MGFELVLCVPPTKEVVKKTDEREKKALALKQEIEDNRTVGQVAYDVHLTNIGEKIRSSEEQIKDRMFLQDCLACWDLLGIDNGERQQVEEILMERFWLVGD